MKNRPKVDRGLSKSAQRTVAAVLDTIEGLEGLFESAYELEALGKVSRPSGSAKDYVGIQRPVEKEVLAKSDLWDLQKAVAGELKMVRDTVVGLERRVERRIRAIVDGGPTEVEVEERAALEDELGLVKMEAEDV